MARSFSASPTLWPVLGELLQDLESLGVVPEEVVEVLRPLGLPRGASVIDLGCGKGSVSLALAERLGLAVSGIDAYPGFIDDARQAAARRGLADRCRFHEADIRVLPGRLPPVDMVLLLSVGDVFGDAAETVATLRQFVRPGGYVVIEDGYATVPGVPAGASSYDQTVAGLTAAGDRIVTYAVGQTPACAAQEARAVQAVERRARELLRLWPGLAASLSAFAEVQREEAALYAGPMTQALWVLERTE